MIWDMEYINYFTLVAGFSITFLFILPNLYVEKYGSDVIEKDFLYV